MRERRGIDREPDVLGFDNEWLVGHVEIMHASHDLEAVAHAIGHALGKALPFGPVDLGRRSEEHGASVGHVDGLAGQTGVVLRARANAVARLRPRRDVPVVHACTDRDFSAAHQPRIARHPERK